MTRLLYVLSIAGLGAAIAAENTYFRIAEAFTPGHGQALEVSYRVYTAPMLSEILATGKLVDRLEISPAGISVEAGQTISLRQLSITAYGPDGEIQQRVPLALDFEGPAELLDFEDFIAFGEPIRAARPGQAKIWITSILPSSDGEFAREPVLVEVRRQGIDSVNDLQ